MRLHHVLIALCVHGATAAVVRKPPAFAIPIYSDAYLPASMQVIFHVVDQLKRLEAEEVEQNLLSTPGTSPHPPGQEQPLPTEPTIGTPDVTQTATVSDEEKYYIPPEQYQEEALIISKPEEVDSGKIGGAQATPEVNHEESEVAYAVPETNYELPESNHEVPETSDVNLSQSGGGPSETADVPENHDGDKFSKPANTCHEFSPNSKLATTSSVDSVVKEIYSIVKTSSSDAKNTNADGISPPKSPPECIEGKNSPESSPAEEDDKERSDELKDDQRFTLLGERVDQVPRPSLMAFLRATNATASPSLRQLGDLYDALSRDARKQGFSKYAGYSDKVLKSLEESAGGGAGVQLRELLEKIRENNELTRYDAMERTRETIDILNDDSSELSTKLRRLIPLPFVP